jgi:hypothetical protein
MQKRHSMPEFFRMINGKTLACSLLELFAKRMDPGLLKDFYYQDDRRISNANLIVSKSFEETV